MRTVLAAGTGVGKDDAEANVLLKKAADGGGVVQVETVPCET